MKTLRYHTNATLTVTSGAVGTYVFRANDLFDPDFTSTGHQPMGFDQMMVFYNHFAVESARIVVQFSNASTTSMRVGIRVDADSTPLTVPDQFIEFGGLTFDAVEGKGIYGSEKTLQLSVDIPKIQGISRNALTSDSTLRGNAAASPSEVTYFHIMAWDPFTASGTVNCDVILEQRSWFMEPRNATESFARSPDIIHVETTDIKSGQLPDYQVAERQNRVIAMAEAAYTRSGNRDVRCAMRR